MERFSRHRASFASHSHSFADSFFFGGGGGGGKFGWCAITKFWLLFLPQETRSITWKSSQRFCIGRACADAILNEKIKEKKKKNCECAWTTFTGKWREKLQAPSACRNRIVQKERECLFQPAGIKKGNTSERSPIKISGQTALSNCIQTG